MTDAKTDISAEAAWPAVDDAYTSLSSERAHHYNAICGDLSKGMADEMDCIDAIRDLCRDNERLAVLARKKAKALTDAEAKIARLTPTPDAELDALVAKASFDLITMETVWQDQMGHDPDNPVSRVRRIITALADHAARKGASHE